MSDSVIVGSLDQDGAREWVLNAFDEGVLVVTELLLVDELGETEVLFGNVVNGVEGSSTACEGNSLSVSSFGSTDADNTLTGKDLERRRVDTLLVNDDEVLVGSLTKFSLELDDLEDLVVGELSLGLDELFTLLSVRPEEAGVHFGLLVLKRDIKAHNVAVLEFGCDITLSATVIEHQTLDKAAIRSHFMLHVHQLDHVEIDGLALLLDGLDGIDDDITKWVSELVTDLCLQGSLGNFQEEFTGDFFLLLELLEEFQTLQLCCLDTVHDASRVDTLTKVSLGLSHELTDEKDVGGGSITNNIILSSGCTTDHSGGRVLDLHLVEEDSSVLGKLNLSGTANKPKNAVKKIILF